MQDVDVDIIDGYVHTRNCNKLTFRMAAIYTVKEALRQAGAIPH